MLSRLRSVCALRKRFQSSKTTESLPVIAFEDEQLKRKVCDRVDITESEKHLLLGLTKGLKGKARKNTLVKMMNVEKERFNELEKDLIESGDLIKTERGVYKTRS